ncbi:MAG: hypothetical protein J2P37_19755 [Ktedonobacteraceae bacterium]|nr:hypothetical protein [Ktedonobacteraceae bacterium]
MRPLLELLGKCGDFQRAEKYYLKLRRMLKEEGRKPDLRTQKTMAEVRACQEPQTHPSVSPVTERPDTTLALPQPSDQRVPSASPRLQGILTTSLLSSLMAGLPDDASLDLPLGVWLAQGAAHFGPLLDQGWSLDHVLETLRILAPIVNAVPVFSQQALRRAMTSSSPHTQRKPITEEERMQLCQMLGESIIAGWKYFISGGNAQVLALGQALLFLVQQTHGLLYPVVRPYCYSGAYGLIGVALHFQERDAEALQAHQSAHIAALATGDPWYVVQSLICQSDCHHALGQYHQALHFIEEALRILGDPLGSAQVCAKAHLLACYADHAMMLADHTTAQEKLEASAIYLDHIVPNEEFDRASWLLLAGKHALLTRAYPTALRSFEDALTQLPAQWTVRRAMTAIGLTKAYARIKEREESLATAENLIPMLETINAHMINRWFAECLQKDLLETFAHDRRVQAFVKDTYQRLPHLPSMTR